MWDLFCCALLCVHSSLAIILMGKTELVDFLCLPLVSPVVVWLFLKMLRVCLHFEFVVVSDHTCVLFLTDIHMVE